MSLKNTNKEEETLYSMVKPLAVVVDEFGWHWRKDMSIGAKTRKLFYLLVFLLLLSSFPYITMRKGSDDPTTATSVLSRRSEILYAVNAFCALLTAARGTTLNRLMALLKTIPVSSSSHAGSRLRVVRVIARTLLYYNILFVVFLLANCPPVESFLGAILTVLYIMLTALCMYSALVAFSLLAPILALFICSVAYFVKLSLEECLSELKRCRSTERRNRSMVKAMDRYYSLYRLARTANAIAAPLLFVMKATAAAIASLCLCLIYSYTVRQSFQWIELFYGIHIAILVVQYFGVYLWYLRVAPSANNFMSLMSRMMLESESKDDQWLFFNHVQSRPRLLRTRVQQLSQLVHLHFEPPLFTTLNEEVDDNDFFTMFFDLISGLISVSAVVVTFG